MNDLREALRSALVTQFRVAPDVLHDNTELFSSGVIDSLSVMDLVCFVEREIGRTVPAADITLENFDSITRIVAFAHTLTGKGKDA